MSSLQDIFNRRPKAILFDWDNTLADNWELIRQSINHTFSHFGVEPWSEEEADIKISKSARDLFSEMFPNDTEKAIELFYGYFSANHIKELILIEPTLEIFKLLKEAKIPVAVVSNKKGAFLRKEIDHFGLTPYIPVIVGAGDAEKDKPFAEPVIKAIKELGLDINDDLSQIWYIGDSLTDVQTAKAAKVTPIIIKTKRMPSQLDDVIKSERHPSFTGLGEFYFRIKTNLS